MWETAYDLSNLPHAVCIGNRRATKLHHHIDLQAMCCSAKSVGGVHQTVVGLQCYLYLLLFTTWLLQLRSLCKDVWCHAELQQRLVYRASAAPSAHGAVCSRHVRQPVEACGGLFAVLRGGSGYCGSRATGEVTVEPVVSERLASWQDTACCLSLV